MGRPRLSVEGALRGLAPASPGGRRRATPQSIGAILGDYLDPRPALYRGVGMRSQLEADFAHYLDLRAIQWVYEPELFRPRRGEAYLPDFRLVRPDGRHYVEVKPLLRYVEEAKRRMAVILQTYPDAVLIVVCAEESRWFGSVAGAEWETWVERWSHA